MKEYILPKRIIKSHNIENECVLLLKRERQVILGEEEKAIVSPGGGYVILDFGREMNGGIQIFTGALFADVPLSSPKRFTATIRVRFGESLMESNAEWGEKNAGNNHAPRDFECLISAHSCVELGGTGYRFVRVDFPATDSQQKGIAIKNIWGTNHILKQPASYRYIGKDERIAQIFQVAKRTIDLCSGSGYVWDGVKRDRTVWSGDIYPETLALTTLYKACPALERSLDLERTRKKIDGVWMCSIPSYNLWWCMSVAEYYFRTGKRAFLDRQLPFFLKNIEIVNEYVNEDGTLKYTKYFVDWPSKETKDVTVGVQCIHIMFANYALRLLKELGRSTDIVENMLCKLKRGNFDIENQKQIIGLKYCAFGAISEEEYQKLIGGGAKGFSTFMSYFILRAIASKDKNLAIALMKEYYGAMLDKGATSFWEDFDMEWVENSCRIDEFVKDGQKDIHGDFGKHCYVGYRHSLCHAWSSGVLRFIEEECE